MSNMPTSQVIIGTRAVMADGSLMATNGAHSVALAARSYAIPVIVLAGLYKLSPEFKCAYNHGTPSTVYYSAIVNDHCPRSALRDDERKTGSRVKSMKSLAINV